MENETKETNFKKSTGLLSIMNQNSGGAFEEIKKEQEHYAKQIFKPEPGKKYVVRFLVDQEDFVIFKEYPYVPINFLKKTGEKVQSYMNFLDVDADHPLKNLKKIFKDEKTGEMKEINWNPRKIVAIPIFVRSMRETNRMGSSVDTPIQQNMLFILSPGKAECNWKMLLELADNAGGTLKDRNYFISKVGEGKESSWSMTADISKNAAEHLDLAQYESIDIDAIIQKSNRWRDPSNKNTFLNVELRIPTLAPVEKGLTQEDVEHIEEYKSLADEL
jgi:hypothetical protein